MQKKYELASLTNDTPKEARTRLHKALLRVYGVRAATLHPATSTFEIDAEPEYEPMRVDIMSAVRKAGFKTSSG